jgi:hypothetical protein|tara:strand:+ start:92385 stop:93245 length:861 start_codon:yes stop_codon:yes gene_type:complete
MSKIIITAKQLEHLSNVVKEQARANNGAVRAYSFDWDDNILHMPTKIAIDYNNGTEWVPTLITTEMFSKVRENENFRVNEDSFVNFRNDNVFFDDLNEALQKRSFAPSFEKFKESLIYANPFSIITARGHTPEVFPKGIKVIIGNTFSEGELEDMLFNIKKKYPETVDYSPWDAIDFYLNENEYHPVTSEEFGKKFGNRFINTDNPEEAKKTALRNYIEKVVNGVSKIEDGNYSQLSIGFSDDDYGNISAVINLIKDELNQKYPQVNFVVYDTSSGDINKIVVKRE